MFKNSQFFIVFLQQFIEKMALQPDKRSLIGLNGPIYADVMLCFPEDRSDGKTLLLHPARGNTARPCC